LGETYIVSKKTSKRIVGNQGKQKEQVLAYLPNLFLALKFSLLHAVRSTEKRSIQVTDSNATSQLHKDTPECFVSQGRNPHALAGGFVSPSSVPFRNYRL
jgi:hypothetical protein